MHRRGTNPQEENPRACHQPDDRANNQTVNQISCKDRNGELQYDLTYLHT